VTDPLAELWPPFRLRVTCGPLVMRPLRDDDFPEVLAVVHAGIHAPDQMPFSFPWTELAGADQEKQFLQFHWGQRSSLKPQAWSLELGVWHEGRFVGVQGVGTQDFPVTRTGETGSWLGMPFQGRGTGTLMRQAICVLCFDHLGFTEVTSGAFLDNPQSRAVSRKVGYVENGRVRLKRRDTRAVNQQLLLTPEALVRPPHPVEVDGVAGVRRLLGIEEPAA
jgi:RimJ/RimL family protein N-acetyltransferase